MGLIDIFPEPSEMTLSNLILMMAVYGYILMRASEVIGDGSEMLMLLYGPGIVGGLVIPILGAVPDCAVILISGMGQGTTEEIQNQLAVGVGTLVGSTVMLLTVPWGLGVILGRRDYDELKDCAAQDASHRGKLTHTGLFTNCVTFLPDITQTSQIMFASLVTYMIIQVPSFFYSGNADGGVKAERPWALSCLIFSSCAFLVYCWTQVKGAEAAERDRRIQEHARRDQWKKTLDRKFSEREHQATIFRLYDKDNSGFIEPAELSAALEHLGLKCGRKDVNELMGAIDVGHVADGDAGKADGRISLHEFQAAIDLWVAAGQKTSEINTTRNAKIQGSMKNLYGAMEDVETQHQVSSDGLLETEDEEEEEEFWHLSDEQIRNRAAFILLCGTICVTIFSDPMVDVITQVGDRLDVSPFYVAFVVTPLASNASEVYAGLLFAKKKTNESISMTLATLHGAATMNNTLALSIFAAIIYARGLEWEYTAEVVTVMTVVSIVALQGMFRRNIFLWQAVLVLSLYPGAILMVYTLQALGLK